MSDLLDRTVISNIWDVGPDNGVRDRFAKPGRRRPRLSGEVSAHRTADPIVRDQLHVGAGICLGSAAFVGATIWALGRLCSAW